MKTIYSYIKVVFILIATTVVLSGCASIVSQSTYPLTINSHPSNASIKITDKRGHQVYLGNTPATVQLKAGESFFTKAEYHVRFSNPGYDDRIVPVIFGLDGWYFGNILLGGVLGMLIVDPATGAMWKLETEFLNETLRPSATASANPEMRILDIKDIPEDWSSYLEAID